MKFLSLVVGGMLFLVTGCKSLLPDKSSTVESRWQSYAGVEAAFAEIIPYHTDTNGLKTLGFYPSVSPNVKVLTYVDIIQIFMPNPCIRREDLPEAVRECIDAREKSVAYQVDFRNVNSHRHGNVFLDVLGFKRNTHEEGWEFKGLILVKNGVIVYKLASGEPRISRDDKLIHPLGPLQELDGTALHTMTSFK
ncbi:MAG TPA: hypothetical protein VH598_07645 [Verrucomicrobiae bacterium]|nr:hypothetical protein [Verrucomicrobiae bacterium]